MPEFVALSKRIVELNNEIRNSGEGQHRLQLMKERFKAIYELNKLRKR
jgi:hypothetical protein